MATQVQLRRGNTTQTNAFTGAVAEITIDTDKDTVVVHDGSTAGGFPLARESAVSANQIFAQAAFNTANASFQAANSAGSYANSSFAIANSTAAYSNTVNDTQNNSITSAFTTANSAGVYANGAFAAANSANVLAQQAFDKANSAITANSVATLNNKTFDVSVSSNNIFSIQGQSIASYSGSGQVLLLQNSPTISVLNLSDSQLNLDGGTGSLYWSGQSGVAQAGDLKAGVYSSDPASNNSLFTFGGAGANVMSVGIEGSLFIGTALPSNDGGLNTTYPGWLVVQSGAKFGGTINTLGALQFDDPATANVIFADGTRQNTAYQTIVWTTANSAGSYANSAFATANNEAGVNLTQNNSITAAFTGANSAGVYANGAFVRANNSINANTGGTITGDLTVTQNLSVGNLFVSGQTFSVSAGTIVANDTLIILGEGNYFSDTKDIGFAGHYNDGTNAHSGLIRDIGTKEWYLFKGYTPEIDANNNVIIADGSFIVDTLNANLKSTTITIKGIDLLPYVNNAYTAANTADNKATSAGVYANGAFVAANTADNKATSAGVYANGAFATANNEAGVNLTQNNSITAAFTTANSAGVYANGAFIAANTADNKATSAGVYANGAFDKANTDVTNITISPSQAYGNATHIPIVTVSANGRINAISTVAVTATDPSAIAFAIALG